MTQNINLTGAEHLMLALCAAASAATAAKTFNITKPSTAAMYHLGAAANFYALQRFIDFKANPSLFIPAVVFCHFLGKSVAKETTGVDFNAKDYFKLVGGSMLIQMPVVFSSTIVISKIMMR